MFGLDGMSYFHYEIKHKMSSRYKAINLNPIPLDIWNFNKLLRTFTLQESPNQCMAARKKRKISICNSISNIFLIICSEVKNRQTKGCEHIP